MPTYQYACTDCGDRTEVVQKFTDDPLSVCATCGGRLRKVFSPVGIVFKGSGFYRTDSRNGPVLNGSGNTKEKSGGSEGSDSSSAKSDSGSESSGKSGSDSGSSSGDKKNGQAASTSSSSGSSSSGSSSSSSSSGSKVA